VDEAKPLQPTLAVSSLYSPSHPMRGNQAVLPTPQVCWPHPSNQGVGTGLGSIWDAGDPVIWDGRISTGAEKPAEANSAAVTAAADGDGLEPSRNSV
jgi:hypothetical protein